MTCPSDPVPKKKYPATPGGNSYGNGPKPWELPPFWERNNPKEPTKSNVPKEDPTPFWKREGSD